MDFFFEPRGIAVIGATPNPRKGGNSIVRNLILGYKGGIYPVNPNYHEIEGLACYPSVRDVEGEIDMAIVFVPARQVPDAVEECAAAGIKGVIIETGGFAEIGEDGRMLQERLISIGRSTGMRIWGPNCMGLVDAVNSRVFSFMDPNNLKAGLTPGSVSLVVQSGMLSAGFLVDIMSHGTMGISKVCSIGNKIDVNECDLLPALLADQNTAAVGMYLESIPEGRRFAEICRGSLKPVVVLKSGKTKKGAEAAMSHTASLASDHKVVAGVLAQAGVQEAHDFKQMMDLSRSLAIYPKKPAGEGRIAILTFSGGAGIVAADFLEEHGLHTADLSQQCRDELKQLFPEWMPVGNPVDIWPAIERHIGSDVDVYGRCVHSIFHDPGVDGALLLVLAGSTRIKTSMADLARQSKATGKPVFVWVLGRRDPAFEMFEEARKCGVPAFSELGRAVECLAAVFREKAPSCVDIPAPPPLKVIEAAGSGPLNEHAAKELFRACGIPVVEEVIVKSRLACVKAADRFGYPVVMKGIEPNVTHKTEKGLVKLGIASRKQARDAYDALMLAMDGKGVVSVQPQVKGGVEIIVGMVRDAQFGPCVMVGLGGVMAEAFQDATFAMAPLTRQEALQLIARIKGQRLLNGFRGMPAVNREELADIIAKVGSLGAGNDRIKEIDINPLMTTETGLMAVDAVVVLA